MILVIQCDEELRAEALILFKQLDSGELDDGEVFATTALLDDILFPNADHTIGSVQLERFARKLLYHLDGERLRRLPKLHPKDDQGTFS